MCIKMLDLGMSPQVGEMNDPQNPMFKMGQLNKSLFKDIKKLKLIGFPSSMEYAFRKKIDA